MNDQEKEFVLYLDTRSFPLEKQEEIKAARKAGLGLIIATTSRQSYEDDVIEHLLEAPLENFEVAEKVIIEYLDSNNLKVKGIVTWGDQFVELVARIGTGLGLPCSSPEAACNVRNKVNTRRLLDQLDSVNPRYAVICDYKTFRAGLDTVGVPCLLKPAGASFGRGIFRINSYDEADSIFHNFRDYCQPSRDKIYQYFRDEFLLEQYLYGSEHSVAGIVADGEVTVLSISDKKINIEIPFQYENIVPSGLSEAIQSQVIEVACRAVKLTGINWCGFHIDFIVTEQGIKILEIGGRLGGECINSHLIPFAYSELYPYDLLLQIIQGNKIQMKRNYVNNAVNQAGMRALLPAKPGRITHLKGLDKVVNYPHTKAFLQLKTLGDRATLPLVKTNDYAIAYFIAQCTREENLEVILADIASLVEIETN